LWWENQGTSYPPVVNSARLKTPRQFTEEISIKCARGCKKLQKFAKFPAAFAKKPHTFAKNCKILQFCSAQQLLSDFRGEKIFTNYLFQLALFPTLCLNPLHEREKEKNKTKRPSRIQIFQETLTNA
jgi:hypothetical protein